MQAGIAYATDQIIDLLANGVKNIHIYSMNKPEVAAKIMAIFLRSLSVKKVKYQMSEMDRERDVRQFAIRGSEEMRQMQGLMN